MRRKDREIIDFEKMRIIVTACDCCRIGLVDNSEAYIVPMNFGCEVVDKQMYLYFHCAKEGRKIDLIRKQKNVTFEMDARHALVEGNMGCDFSYLYQCVMGKGTMEILEKMEDKVFGLQKIMAHYSESGHWEFKPEYVDRVEVLKLSVEQWSCKEH